jgi:hypothetical protein
VGNKPAEKSDTSDHKKESEVTSFYAKAITLAEKLAVSTPKEARQTISIESLRPFESRMVEGTRVVCVPSNIESLVADHYIFTLAALCLKHCDHKIVEGREYTPTFKHTADQILCLNGFGAPIVEEKVPNFRNDIRGAFKKGLLSAMTYIVEEVKFCDKRWFIFNESKNIMLTLFGEAWATKHQDEKIILDFIISILKTQPIFGMDTYLINVDELRKRLGLKANRHKNAVISDDEQKFIEEDYKDILKQIREFKYDEYKNWMDLITHMKRTVRLCKDAKPYSDLCKEIINDRLTWVFKGQKKNKKLPIMKLIDDKKSQDVIGYIKVFNPCRSAGINTPFRIGSVPSSKEDESSFKKSFVEWKNSIKGGRYGNRIPMIESWYYEVLGL